MLKALYTTELKVEKDTIFLCFASRAIQDEFDKIKGQFLIPLKKELNNFYIILEYKIIEVKNNNVIYTSEEKFKYFSEKNPDFLELVHKLDLDKGF